MTQSCSVWWCDKPHYALGYCKAHLTAVKRFGTPYGKKLEEFARIDDTITIGRKIATVALAVAETSLTGICPYCGANTITEEEHEKDCIYNWCKIFLESTRRSK